MSANQPTTVADPLVLRRALKDALVSVVLPVFNEAKVLDELVGRVTRAVRLTGARLELVFVNDGSTDGTAAALDRLAAEKMAGDCPKSAAADGTVPFSEAILLDALSVRVLHLSRNFGHQAAVQAGLAHTAGDVVVLMDSDLQDSPEAIPRLLNEWQAGYDVAYAIRAARPESLWKCMLFTAFHRLLSRIAAPAIPAGAGNFSAIDRRVVREITALGERDRYLPGLRSWVGYRQKGVEVRREARYDARPRVSLVGLWRLAKSAIFSFSSFPLTVFYLIGYSALAVFLGLSGYSLFCRLITGSAIPGWTSNVLVASFFGAVNALGISILGEYVTRIYDQVRARPLYFIERTVNSGAGQATNATAMEEQLLEESRALLDVSVVEGRKLPSAEEAHAASGRG